VIPTTARNTHKEISLRVVFDLEPFIFWRLECFSAKTGEIFKIGRRQFAFTGTVEQSSKRLKIHMH